MKLTNVFKIIWRYLRTVSGDNAYETYLQHHQNDSEVLTRSEFYKKRLEKKSHQKNRCC